MSLLNNKGIQQVAAAETVTLKEIRQERIKHKTLKIFIKLTRRHVPVCVCVCARVCVCVYICVCVVCVRHSHSVVKIQTITNFQTLFI